MSMFKEGSVLARPFRLNGAEQEAEISEQQFFASVDDTMMLESIQKVANTTDRLNAASAVQQWSEGGESSPETLEAMLYGLAGGDEDGEHELNAPQVAMFESLARHASEFISHVTDAPTSKLIGFRDGDYDDVDFIFESIEQKLEGQDTDVMIAEFAVRENMMLEAMKKVVRDGEVVYINTNKRKRRMSPAQKAALKKARAKANTAAAKAARKKSMKLRDAAGMD